MRLLELLCLKYPLYDYTKDVIVALDKQGNEYIKEWNIADVAQPSLEEIYDIPNELKRQDIKNQLLSLDIQSIRAIREGDEVKISEYEAQAIALREEL